MLSSFEHEKRIITSWPGLLFTVTPCTSEEHYDPAFLGTCLSSECRGRCVNFTNHIITDFQVCCLSEETFRQPTHPSEYLRYMRQMFWYLWKTHNNIL